MSLIELTMNNKEIQINVDARPKESRFHRLLKIAHILSDRDYFSPDQQRVMAYLTLDRSMGISVPRTIPIGKDEVVPYSGEITGAVSDRPIGSYQSMLFPDVFVDASDGKSETYSAERFLSEARRREQAKPFFGGYETALQAGKVVLDIASGEAVALAQFSLQFPGTTFIGVDSLYQNEERVFLNKKGMQLVKDDWRFLRTIPDGSIDTILSCQGVSMWGLPGISSEDVSEEDGLLVVNTLQRISKPGTVIRFDDTDQNATVFLRPFLEKNWEIVPHQAAFIAQKLR